MSQWKSIIQVEHDIASTRLQLTQKDFFVHKCAPIFIATNVA